MKKVNVEVNVLIGDMKKTTEEIIKNQERITETLEGLMDDKSRRQFEEIKKLPPDEQRKWAIETTERIVKRFREYLKEGDYIG